MPVTSEKVLTARLKYLAAFTAYRSCIAALSRSGSIGEPPPTLLLEQEAKAHEDLSEARSEYREALLAITRAPDDQRTH
jgi:hypothetical protein